MSSQKEVSLPVELTSQQVIRVVNLRPTRVPGIRPIPKTRPAMFLTSDLLAALQRQHMTMDELRIVIARAVAGQKTHFTIGELTKVFSVDYHSLRTSTLPRFHIGGTMHRLQFTIEGVLAAIEPLTSSDELPTGTTTEELLRLILQRKYRLGRTAQAARYFKVREREVQTWRDKGVIVTTHLPTNNRHHQAYLYLIPN